MMTMPKPRERRMRERKSNIGTEIIFHTWAINAEFLQFLIIINKISFEFKSHLAEETTVNLLIFSSH